jgi:hypothetical protein
MTVGHNFSKPISINSFGCTTGDIIQHQRVIPFTSSISGQKMRGERSSGLRPSDQGAIGRFVHSRSARRDERNHPPAAPVPPSVGMV